MGTDIPLWIGGLQKWVTGVTKQTTCEDIIRAVLSANATSSSRSGNKRDHKHYVIVERWHKVEKPLDPRSRLLKVWNTWGLEQCNVRFLLKRAHHAQTSGSTPRDIKSHRRKAGSSKSTKTWHPRKLRSESEDEASVICCLDNDDHFPATEEQLRNLIASQTEEIAAQMKKLRLKDEEIDVIEGEIHTQRMRQIGANYVLDTYLAETNEPPESTSATTVGNTDGSDPPPNSSSDVCDTIDTCIELYQKVLLIWDRVHQEEKTIKDLTLKIQQSLQQKESESNCKLLDDAPEIAFASPERMEEILSRTKSDIERLLRINQTQQLTIQQNEKTLLDCAKIIQDKHFYLQHLKSDLDRLDQDNARLQEEFSAIQVISMDRNGTCEVPENGDSNSDTGLSSLHSSSDDGANILDTLV